MTPEFSRPHPLDRIGEGAKTVSIAAESAERAALAARFDLESIESLTADYHLRRTTGEVRATGHLSAKVVQHCVVTGDPVPASVEEDFEIRFLPDSQANEEEVELDAEDCDIVFYAGGAIDLGEAAAETLALALDPFPRSPAAAKVLKEAGVVGEDEVAPFNAFAVLKDKLGK